MASLSEHDHPTNNGPTGDEFVAVQNAVTSWARHLWNSIADRPVRPTVAPGTVADALQTALPESPESLATVVEDIDALFRVAGEPWTHPGRMAHFPATVSVPALLGGLLSRAHNCHVWPSNLASTELEMAVVDQLADALGLSESLTWRGGGGGAITDSATTAVQLALLAAATRASDGDWRERGVRGDERVYVSAHTHSSVTTATIAAGLGTRALHLVGTDSQTHAMSPSALTTALRADLNLGLRPVLVVATLGTTSTGAVDDLRQLGAICNAHGAWLHVDAAWAGAYTLLPECRSLIAGLEYATSYSMSPHKLLQTGLGCSVMWTTCPKSITRALAMAPEYLRTHQVRAEVDLRDWQFATGRPDRAVILWMALRGLGLSALRVPLRRHIELTQQLAAWVHEDPRWTLGAPPSLGLVCLTVATHRGVSVDNAATAAVLNRVNAGTRVLASHTVVDGRFMIRIAAGAARRRHLRVVRAELCQAMAALKLARVGSAQPCAAMRCAPGPRRSHRHTGDRCGG